jgi:hypothetical protein
VVAAIQNFIDTVLNPVALADGNVVDEILNVTGIETWLQGFVHGIPILEQQYNIIVSIVNGILNWVQTAIFDPIFGGTTITEFTAWATSLPIISDLAEIFSGVEDGDLSDIGTAWNTWTGNLTATWNTIVDAMDIDRDGDADLTDLGIALGLIPAPSVLGSGGAATQQDTWQAFWDNIVSALTGGAVTGQTMATVNTALAQQAMSVATHEATLGLRDNLPAYSGLDGTIVPVFPVADLTTDNIFWNQLDDSWFLYGFIRIKDEARFSSVSWIGYNTADITMLGIDVFLLDNEKHGNTGDLLHIDGSGNLISGVSDTVAWNTWNPGLGNIFAFMPGDVAVVRMMVGGLGTYYVAGIDVHDTMPVNTAMLPAALAAYSGTSPGEPNIEYGNYSWDTGVPWFGLGIGTVGSHSAVLREFNDPGFVVDNVPEWVNYIDFIIVPGAGGGRSGDIIGGNGQGGQTSGWVAGTLTRGAEFDTDATQIGVTVGSGGAGGLYNSPVPGSNPGSNGTYSAVQINKPGGGQNVYTATGGLGGTLISGLRDVTGQSPGNVSYADHVFYGGAAQTVAGYGGNFPGGGGAGGSNVFGAKVNGGDGANGIAWLNYRQ